MISTLDLSSLKNNLKIIVFFYYFFVDKKKHLCNNTFNTKIKNKNNINLIKKTMETLKINKSKSNPEQRKALLRLCIKRKIKNGRHGAKPLLTAWLKKWER